MSALLHAFSQPAKPEADFIKIVKGSGSTLWDDAGKAYIDGLASLWLCQVGHGEQRIVDAITAQLQDLQTYNIFDPFTNGPAAEVADMIAARSPHPDGRVFLGCSGSEAVDTVLKLARLVQQRRGSEDKQMIVRRTGGYHGTNFGGTTSQGIEPNREGWGDLLPHFVEAPANDIEATSQLFAEHGDRVAAVICEPIQGAGGVVPPEEGYLQGLRRLCDEHGALLVFDEVICGFGRTGEWFGAQHFGVTPDLMTFAKGVTSGYQPLSGVIVSRSIADELEEPDFLLRTGYTYSGHPAACAAGIANIQVLEDDGLIDRAKWVGQRLDEGFAALAGDGLIESYRGEGAVYAGELGRDAVPVRNALLDRGVICRPIGEALALCPPLVITEDELGQVFDSIHDVLKA